MVVGAPLCHLQRRLRQCNYSSLHGCRQLLLSKILGELTMAYGYPKPKSVHVNAYIRFRFGRMEQVCQHWRSVPQQFSLM